MAWTLCTSGAAVAKAGVNANSTIILSGAVLAEWSNECEGALNTITRKDWISAYSGLAANHKNILNDTCSDMIALKIVNYDMNGYTSRLEAQTILDVLRDNMVRNIEVIKDQNNKTIW